MEITSAEQMLIINSLLIQTEQNDKPRDTEDIANAVGWCLQLSGGLGEVSGGRFN